MKENQRGLERTGENGDRVETPCDDDATSWTRESPRDSSVRGYEYVDDETARKGRETEDSGNRDREYTRTKADRLAVITFCASGAVSTENECTEQNERISEHEKKEKKKLNERETRERERERDRRKSEKETGELFF